MSRRKKGKKFLVFTTNNEQFIIPIEKVSMIEKVEYDDNHHDKRIKKVSSFPEYIEGLFSYKSNPIPIIDFEYFLSKNKIIRHHENKIIIIRSETSEFGILVNDVSVITDFESNDFKKVLKDYPFYSTVKDGEIYIVPDIEELTNKEDVHLVFQSIQQKIRQENN